MGFSIVRDKIYANLPNITTLARDAVVLRKSAPLLALLNNFQIGAAVVATRMLGGNNVGV